MLAWTKHYALVHSWKLGLKTWPQESNEPVPKWFLLLEYTVISPSIKNPCNCQENLISRSIIHSRKVSLFQIMWWIWSRYSALIDSSKKIRKCSNAYPIKFKKIHISVGGNLVFQCGNPSTGMGTHMIFSFHPSMKESFEKCDESEVDFRSLLTIQENFELSSYQVQKNSHICWRKSCLPM